MEPIPGAFPSSPPATATQTPSSSDESVLHYLIHTPLDTPVSLPSITLPSLTSSTPADQTFIVSTLHSPIVSEFSCFSFTSSVYQHLDRFPDPMAAPALPIFTPMLVTSISQQEWQDFMLAVNDYYIHILGEISNLDPLAVLERSPQVLWDDPTAPTM